MYHLSGHPPCHNCGIAIKWAPVRVDDQVYCCRGCSLGGPCTCSYDEPAQPGASALGAPFIDQLFSAGSLEGKALTAVQPKAMENRLTG